MSNRLFLPRNTLYSDTLIAILLFLFVSHYTRLNSLSRIIPSLLRIEFIIFPRATISSHNIFSIGYRFSTPSGYMYTWYNRKWRDLTEFSFDSTLCAPWKSGEREYYDISTISIYVSLEYLLLSLRSDLSFDSGLCTNRMESGSQANKLRLFHVYCRDELYNFDRGHEFWNANVTIVSRNLFENNLRTSRLLHYIISRKRERTRVQIINNIVHFFNAILKNKARHTFPSSNLKKEFVERNVCTKSYHPTILKIRKSKENAKFTMPTCLFPNVHPRRRIRQKFHYFEPIKFHERNPRERTRSNPPSLVRSIRIPVASIHVL